jgi:hypothetical protein
MFRTAGGIGAVWTRFEGTVTVQPTGQLEEFSMQFGAEDEAQVSSLL